MEFHRWILAAVLVMARMGAAFAICPALTESMIPGVARRAAVFALSVFKGYLPFDVPAAVLVILAGVAGVLAANLKNRAKGKEGDAQ